jgi:hypothetical protein
VPFSFEFFEGVNDNQPLINRTHWYGGIGYVMSKGNRIEIFYIANAARNAPAEDFETVNVLRVRWHFTFAQ